MIHTLTKDQHDFIIENVVKPLEEEGAVVYIFGSRAEQTHSKFSDLDLLIKIKEVNTKILRLKSEIEEFLVNSNFPFKVDLVFQQDLAESYKENINKQKLKF